MRCNMQLVTVNLEGCFSFSWTSSPGGGRLHWPSGLLPWNMNQWSSHLRQCSVPECHKSPPNLWVPGFSQTGKHLKRRTTYICFMKTSSWTIRDGNNGCPPMFRGDYTICHSHSRIWTPTCLWAAFCINNVQQKIAQSAGGVHAVVTARHHPLLRAC